MGCLTEPILLNREKCLEYKERLTGFYYSNIKTCAFMDNFTYKDAEQKIDSLIEHVSNGSAIVYGVFDSENLIGYVWAYEHPFREEVRLYVNEIHVEEAYRNKGIGKKLLHAIEDMVKERGYGALYIHAEGNNDGAIRLYQNEGYEIERIQLRKEL